MNNTQDNIKASGEFLNILKRILEPQEVISIGMKIREWNACSEDALPSVAMYLSARIYEQMESGALYGYWKIVRYKSGMDGDYDVLATFRYDEENEAANKLEEMQGDDETYDDSLALIHSF